MIHFAKIIPFKNLLLYLLFSGMLITAQAQTTLKDKNLNGKVTSVTETTYTSKMENGKPVKDKYTAKNVLGFDPAGRLLEATEFDQYKKKTKTMKYLYDVSGQLTNEKEFEFKTLKSTTKYTYLSNGKLSGKAFYAGPDEKSIGKITYTYNNKGQQSETTENSNTVHSKTVKEYNEKNLVIKEDVTNTETGKQLLVIQHDYDTLGRETRISRKFMQNGFSMTTEFNYNEMGNITGNTTTAQGQVTKAYYRYDTHNNIIASNEKNEWYTCEYTYDAKENWVKCIKKTSRNGNLTYEIVEREIDYAKE